MRLHPLFTHTFTAIAILFCSQAFAAPADKLQSVTYNGETITMRMKLQNLRGSHFEVKSQNSTGSYDDITPVAERSYIGTVDGYPGAVACGILQDDGFFRGAVYFDRGVTWFTLGNTVESTQALEYSTFDKFKIPTSPTVSAGQAGSVMFGYDVGIDVKNTYYQGPGGSSVAKTLELIEYNFCLTRAIYMRDALLRPYLARVIIRADKNKDPYDSAANGTDFLNTLIAEWNNNQTGAVRALVAGVSVNKVKYGLATMGTVGHENGASVNDGGSDGSFHFVYRHEMGHNWGCGHSVGGSPEGTGIMGGNQPARFSGPEVYKILSSRTISYTAKVLNNEGTFTAVELPPYASLDSVSFRQTEDSSININVLANDHDANGQSLSIARFDETSQQGATITQQGQNLVYTNHHGSYVGSDYFKYVIKDTAGNTATGVVVIDVQEPSGLKLLLPLDETVGNAAYDRSTYKVSATLAITDFPTSSVSGKFGRALELDGSNYYLVTGGVALNSNTVTLTAWIKSKGTQNEGADIIFDRNDSGYGLHFGPSNELRFTWGGRHDDWSSGLTPPDNTWTFVALVIEPTKATIYMNSGSGFESSSKTNLNLGKGFNGPLDIGRGARFKKYFKGSIDDVRIYGKSIPLTQLQTIYQNLKAHTPAPFVSATEVTSAKLAWISVASNHQIYLGTSATAVDTATTRSSEYQGETAANIWPAVLATNTKYFWRVDSITGSTTTKGEVWSFITAAAVDEAGLVAHWRMDTGSGTTAIDSSLNSNHGIIENGASWQSGYLDQGKGLSFNLALGHYHDHIKAGTGPSLSGKTNFTVSAWIKTTYKDYSNQVIIQQGDGDTMYGQYRLRVNKNGTVHFYLIVGSGDQFNFSTDTVVNDGQWHFITAVREGGTGSIYIDGNLAKEVTGTIIRDLNPNLGVSIGEDLKYNRDSFEGSIDEVKIYDYAKNAKQVKNDYNRYTGMELWKVTHFDAAANDPTVAGPNADPDKDGIPNLLEYAFALDPNSADPSAQIRSEATATTFSLIYPRNTGAKDINFIIEGSVDLSDNSWKSVTISETILSTSNGVETVKATFQLGSDQRYFLRLRVKEK